MPNLSLINNEVQHSWQQRSHVLQPVLFFLLVCLLFPFAVGASSSLILSLLPAIIWVGLLLAVLMSVAYLFRAEYEDGQLELMLLSNQSIHALVLLKLLTHWLSHIVPLLMIAVFTALALGLDLETVKVLALTIVLGTPSLVMIGAAAAALTLVSKQNTTLLALLVLPLYVPVLIFASSAVSAATQQLSVAGSLYALSSLLLLTLSLSPFAIVAALKLGVSQ